jgi:hypothetical protein
MGGQTMDSAKKTPSIPVTSVGLYWMKKPIENNDQDSFWHSPWFGLGAECGLLPQSEKTVLRPRRLQGAAPYRTKEVKW